MTVHDRNGGQPRRLWSSVIDDKLNNCKTVEDVEKLWCYNCANNHHFGWCDVEGIVCPAKSKIKAITGEHGHSITLEEHIERVIEEASK